MRIRLKPMDTHLSPLHASPGAAMVQHRERAAVRAPHSASGSGPCVRARRVAAVAERSGVALGVCGTSRQARALCDSRRLTAL